MKILVLDDERCANFKSMLEGVSKDVTLCDNYPSFEEALKKLDYDVVFLDHDLGTEHNGVDAAKIIAALPPEKMPTTVVIHSWNIFGAHRMEGLLEGVCPNVQRIPYHWRLVQVTNDKIKIQAY